MEFSNLRKLSWEALKNKNSQKFSRDVKGENSMTSYRSVLTRSFNQSIPMHAMLFQLHASICNKVDSLNRDFF